MPRGTDLDAVTVRGSSNSFRISDVVNMLEYPTKNGKAGWVTIRLFGPVYSDAFFWAKAKQGSNKSFRVQCRCYDPDSHQCLPEKYDPWYDEYRRECDENIDRKDRLLQYSKYFYMQAIVRKLQDNMPAKNRLTAHERKTGFKDPDSDSYTPVVVVQLTPKILSAIQEFKEDNIVKLKSGTRKAYHVTDEKFGRDIMIKKDMSPGVAPGDIYQVKLAVDSGRTPLTEEEKSYLIWDMNTIYAPEQSEEQVKRDFESWARRMGLTKRQVEVAEEDDDTDDFEAPSTPKLKKRSKPVEEEDDFESDDSDDFDDDEEEEASKSSKKSKKVVEEDDDDFDDEDDSDDFGDEDEPKSRKNSSKKSKKVVEDDDDDFDDDFDDEEEDAPKPSKKSKKVVEDDDEFEDDADDFDEDEEDEEPKPVKKSVKKKPVKKSKPSVEDDDDEFEDDDDDF